MRSNRLAWTSAENPLSRLLGEKRSRGDTVFDLTESNPTRADIYYPVKEILAALASPLSLVYHPAPTGIPTARDAVAGYYQARGVHVSADDVVLTASTSEAYSFLFKLLCNPGDRILVPRPSYPLLEYLAALESVEIDYYSLVYDGEWRVDVESVEAAVSERTRALVVVNPNNPTGSFLKRDELESLLRVLRSYRLALVSDEVFSDYGFGEAPNRIRSLVGSTEGVLAFALNGLSKVAGLPQVKLGWIVVHGPDPERKDALSALEHIGDTFLSVSAPAQNGAPALLALAPRLQTTIHERLFSNYDALRGVLGADSACRPLQLEGGWYAVLRLPLVLSSEEWSLEILARDGVHAHPGYLFDFAAEAHLVVSLVTPPDTFRVGIERIAARVAAVLEYERAR